MTDFPDTTPALKLTRLPANYLAWAEIMNGNLSLMDAAVGAYFTLNDLQGVWENSHAYSVDQTVVDEETGTVWTCQIAHTSPNLPTTFAEARDANPTYWTVYSSPARARGAWTGPGTTYGVNDFVVAGPKYAVCIAAHTSTANFDNDVNSGFWSVLVDLSAAGSQVLPVPQGATDANKFVVITPSGQGYTIVDAGAALTLLGATSFGEALFTATSADDARVAINAQIAGSYQAASATLAALSNATTATFGISLLALTDATGLRNAAALGTAAVLNVGTGANQVLQLDGSAKIPAVDGSALLNLVMSQISGTLPRSQGGFIPDYQESFLVASVPLNNTSTYFDGPSLTLSAGTWIVVAQLQLVDTFGAANFDVRLVNAALAVQKSLRAYGGAANAGEPAMLCARVVLGSTQVVKAQVVDITSTNGFIAHNLSGQGKDSSIMAWRIA